MLQRFVYGNTKNIPGGHFDNLTQLLPTSCIRSCRRKSVDRDGRSCGILGGGLCHLRHLRVGDDDDDYDDVRVNYLLNNNMLMALEMNGIHKGRVKNPLSILDTCWPSLVTL